VTLGLTESVVWFDYLRPLEATQSRLSLLRRLPKALVTLGEACRSHKGINQLATLIVDILSTEDVKTAVLRTASGNEDIS